jgi:hypothetical protein
MLFGAGSVRKCRRLDGAAVADQAAAGIDLFDNFLLVKVEGRLRDVTLTGVPQVSIEFYHNPDPDGDLNRV